MSDGGIEIAARFGDFALQGMNRDTENVRSRRRSDAGVVDAVGYGLGLNVGQLGLGFVELTVGDIGAAAHVTPHAVEIRRAAMALLAFKDAVPFAEDLVHDPGMHYALLAPVHGFGGRADAGGAALGRFERIRVVALQHVGVAHEVQRVGSVRLVRQAIGADHRKIVVAPDFGELQIDDLGAFVGRNRLFVLAHAQIDVTGHMHHVSRNRHAAFQLLRRRHGQFWFVGSFHQVNVEMVGAGMVVFDRHGGFERGAGLGDPGTGRTVGLPVIPAGGVHERFGKDGSDVGVIGILVMQVAHGADEGLIPFAVVGDRVRVVEHEQRIDHVPLALGAVVDALERVTDRFEAGALGVVRQAGVAAVGIGPGGVSQAEIRHGMIRIVARSFLVGSDGLRKVKTPGHAQALVEKGLGFGRIGRNRPAVSAAAGDHNGECLAFLGRGHVPGHRGRQPAGGQNHESFHELLLFCQSIHLRDPAKLTL